MPPRIKPQRNTLTITNSKRDELQGNHTELEDFFPNPRTICRELGCPEMLPFEDSLINPRGPKGLRFCYDFDEVDNKLSFIPLYHFFNAKAPSS